MPAPAPAAVARGDRAGALRGRRRAGACTAACGRSVSAATRSSRDGDSGRRSTATSGTATDDWGLGYVAGGAYEIPEIALRVALTYGSKTEHHRQQRRDARLRPADRQLRHGAVGDRHHHAAVGQPRLPDRAQPEDACSTARCAGRTGRAGTWRPRGSSALIGAPLVEFEHDTWHYKLGIGRQLTERIAGAFEVVHETATGDIQTALTPYDGFTGVHRGRQLQDRRRPQRRRRGAATASSAMPTWRRPTGVARFEDNHALGVGLQLGYQF